MKQQIICPACKDINRELFKTDTPHPGEHVKFVSGFALSDFVCDDCAVPIEKDTECCAFSIWADYGGIPYYPWENDCIEPVDENDLAVAKEMNKVMGRAK